MTLPIDSQRLLLRRFSYDDIQDLIEFVSHPSVAEEVSDPKPNEESARAYVDKQNSFQPFEKDKVFDLAIERKADGKVIGLVTMITKNHQKGELGYGLGTDFRGKGYATEAARAITDYGFAQLKYHRVQAIVSAANPVSMQVLVRLGMKQEGRLREATENDGDWHDLLYYGVLADEWQTPAQAR